MMRQILEKLLENKTIVEIYVDNEIDAFYTGYISAVDDNWFILNHLSKRGEYDGFLLIWVEDVFQICEDSEYVKKIAALHQIRQSKHDTIEHNESVFWDYLKYVHQKQSLVAVYRDEDKEECIVGKVLAYTEDVMTLLEYDEYGREEGKHYISMEYISRMEYDRIKEQDVLAYAEIRKKMKDIRQ